jgi:hypothetical protein
MALFGEHLNRGLLVAILGGAILCLVCVLIWRRFRTNLAWEQGLAGPVLRESVQRAIREYRRRLGGWPAGKADIERGLDVPEKTVELAGKWDCRLVSSSRDGRKARYSIFISGGWTDWDARIEAAPGDRRRAGRAKRDAAG